MGDRFAVFDVETPNYNNDRISAIGVCIVEDDEIKLSKYWLCNPETYFNSFNIQLTGITPDDVADAMNFSELWEELLPLFDGRILIAHNAPFDMGVLAKCCKAYGISDLRYVPYACTVRMSKRAFPDLPNHKLNTVSDFLGIDLLHHRADSDTLACAKILLACMEQGVSVIPFINVYDLHMGRKL